jgi:hypothetical protein
MASKSKHFGGYDGPPKTVGEALERAGDLDERRQEQIANQTAIINRLLAENQEYEAALESIKGTDPSGPAGEIANSTLANINEQRLALRNQAGEKK